MYINQILNGVGAAFLENNEKMFAAIAEKFELPLGEVRATAQSAVDGGKLKPIKPQKRQAKRTGDGKKRKRVQSGYQMFCKNGRIDAKRLLMENADERTFKCKQGTEIVIDSADFKTDGEPTFAQITQKVASMWNALGEEGQKAWKDKAKVAAAEANKNESSDEEEKGGRSSEEQSEEKKVQTRKMPPRKTAPKNSRKAPRKNTKKK